MKSLFLYGCFLFIGLPMIIFSVHLATLPEEAKHGLAEAAKDFNGRIYTARISCGRGRQDHVMRVHGRTRDDARRKITAQLRTCNVEILETASAPIWQKALRSAF